VRLRAQSAKAKENLDHARRMSESSTSDFERWYQDRVCHLPGDLWPEAWLLTKALESPDALSRATGCQVDDLKNGIQMSPQAGKYSEFHEMSKHLGLEPSLCLHATAVCEAFPTALVEVRDAIQKALDEVRDLNWREIEPVRGSRWAKLAVIAAPHRITDIGSK
jgi:hypothetical protein